MKQAHQLELELYLLPDVGDNLCCFAALKVEISSPGAHEEASADSIPSDLKIATNLDPGAQISSHGNQLSSSPGSPRAGQATRENSVKQEMQHQ